MITKLVVILQLHDVIIKQKWMTIESYFTSFNTILYFLNIIFFIL